MTPDPLVMKTVCFDVRDKKYGSQLAHHPSPFNLSRLEPSLGKIDGISYLFGTIWGPIKKVTRNIYEVQWEDASLGMTPIDISILILEVELQATRVGSLQS